MIVYLYSGPHACFYTQGVCTSVQPYRLARVKTHMVSMRNLLQNTLVPRQYTMSVSLLSSLTLMLDAPRDRVRIRDGVTLVLT